MRGRTLAPDLLTSVVILRRTAFQIGGAEWRKEAAVEREMEVLGEGSRAPSSVVGNAHHDQCVTFRPLVVSSSRARGRCLDCLLVRRVIVGVGGGGGWTDGSSAAVICGMVGSVCFTEIRVQSLIVMRWDACVSEAGSMSVPRMSRVGKIVWERRG